MEKAIYTEALKEQLENIKKASHELAKEDSEKSVEQFLAEVDFTKMLLEETKRFIH
jgi:hypothetical protein